MSCSDPVSISGGTVVTTGPYVDGSTAVYVCNSGYAMSGTPYITCSTSVWSASPTCNLQDTNQVTVNLNESGGLDDYQWLVYIVAAACGLLCILILTCLFVWCCQLMGCYGPGGIFGHPVHGRWRRFCCCTYNEYQRKTTVCKTFPRRYEYDEHGRRFHFDDYGRPCYYDHKVHKVTSVTPESDHADTPKTTFVNSVNEILIEKKQQPAKELATWKPHANPVRNINTSTK